MEINYKAQVEAILFTMGESVEKNRIAKALDITQGQLKKIVKEMQEDYAKDHRGIKIIELENSYQLCTKPELYETLIRVAKQPKRQVLTDVMMETLSIIAYKQPITKSEIESIRGVSVDRIISNLEERKFVRNCGKQESGRKANLYEVTDKFLSYLGIKNITELPDYDLLKEKIKSMENMTTNED